MKKSFRTVLLLLLASASCSFQFETGSTLIGLEKYSPELCFNVRHEFYVISRSVLAEVARGCDMTVTETKKEDDFLTLEENVPTKCDSQADTYIAISDYNCLVKSQTLDDLKRCNWVFPERGVKYTTYLEKYRLRLIASYCENP